MDGEQEPHLLEVLGPLQQHEEADGRTGKSGESDVVDLDKQSQ